MASPVLLAFFAAPLCVRLAWRMNLIDRPRADRFHAGVVPKLGGLVLTLAILPVVLARLGSPYAASLAGGWAIAFAAGLADDRWHLRPRTKFGLQVLASAASVVPVVVLEGTPASLPALPAVVSIGAGLLWVTTFQNAVNFLDNMDGISAGVGAAALLGLASILAPPAVAVFALAVALACLGFLPWNVSRPARLYLGDAGSLPLGHAVGAASWLALMQAPDFGAAAAVVPVVAIPLFDLTFVTVVRLREGRSPSVGGRDHTTHRLFQRLGSVSAARTWFWAGGVVLAALGIALRAGPSWGGLGAGMILLAGAALGGRWFAGLPTPQATARQN